MPNFLVQRNGDVTPHVTGLGKPTAGFLPINALFFIGARMGSPRTLITRNRDRKASAGVVVGNLGNWRHALPSSSSFRRLQQVSVASLCVLPPEGMKGKENREEFILRGANKKSWSPA